MPPASLHTMVSTHAVGLSEMFRLAMAKLPLGKFRVEMTAPEQSTAGGARALQHIRIVPKNEGDGHALVVGNANVSTGQAELRLLELVEDTYRERFGEPLGVDPAAYATFLDEAQAILQNFSLTVQRVGKPEPLAVSEPPPKPASRGVLLGFVLGAVFATVFVAWFFLSRR